MLRPWRPSDAPALLQVVAQAPDLDRQLPPLPDLAAAGVYLRWAGLPAHRCFALVRGHDLLGSVSITQISLRHRTGWFHYWMSAAGRGQGLAQRAATTVANWALGVGGLFRLELGHRVDNPASGRVAERAGFITEGLERAKFSYQPGVRTDVRTMARLATDPVPACDPIRLLQAVPVPELADRGSGS